jgi:HSP20 family protein
MVKRIKPVSRIIKVDAEISRIKRESQARREKLQDWGLSWLPLVDVYEKKDEIVVEAEIPGVSETDVEITVQSNRVEIKGLKKEGISSGKIKFLRLEREFGAFRRLVALPSTVVPDRAKAVLTNGVLKIHLKKYLPQEENDG